MRYKQNRQSLVNLANTKPGPASLLGPMRSFEMQLAAQAAADGCERSVKIKSLETTKIKQN